MSVHTVFLIIALALSTLSGCVPAKTADTSQKGPTEAAPRKRLIADTSQKRVTDEEAKKLIRSLRRFPLEKWPPGNPEEEAAKGLVRCGPYFMAVKEQRGPSISYLYRLADNAAVVGIAERKKFFVTLDDSLSRPSIQRIGSGATAQITVFLSSRDHAAALCLPEEEMQ